MDRAHDWTGATNRLLLIQGWTHDLRLGCKRSAPPKTPRTLCRYLRMRDVAGSLHLPLRQDGQFFPLRPTEWIFTSCFGSLSQEIPHVRIAPSYIKT